MTVQYQIQAAKSEVEKLQFQVNDLLINAKEYDASWLKDGAKVVRDASGKFSKGAGDAAKSVSDAAKSAGAEAVSRYGGAAEIAEKKAGDIKKSIEKKAGEMKESAYNSQLASDIKTSAGLLVASFAEKVEQVDKLSSETKTKISAAMASPAVTSRMDAISAAMGNLGKEAKKGYDSAMAKIMAAKGNIGTQLNAAKDSASKVAASAQEKAKPLTDAIKEKAKPATDAMEDMGAHAANQLFHSYVSAIMSAKNLAGIIAKGDAGVLKKVYSLPVSDTKSVKDAIAPLLDKMNKWANTAPEALQEKYAGTVSAIEKGFTKSFEQIQSANPGKVGNFDNQSTNA